MTGVQTCALPISLLDIAHDRIKDDFYCVTCFFLASVEVRSQRSNELGLVHLFPLRVKISVRLSHFSIYAGKSRFPRLSLGVSQKNKSVTTPIFALFMRKKLSIRG